MVGQHDQFNGLDFEQTLGDSEGQGALACCTLRGLKESDTSQQLNNKNMFTTFNSFSSLRQATGTKPYCSATNTLLGSLATENPDTGKCPYLQKPLEQEAGTNMFLSFFKLVCRMGLWAEMKTTPLRTQSVYSELELGKESASAACV